MNTQQKLLELADREGGQVFIIGGYVRDRLLGRECHDHDFVVTDITSEQMLSLGFDQVGADFPVFLAPNGDEFALARTERKTGSGYKGFDTVTGGVSLTDDLLRRDLTINAMAREVLSFKDNGHAVLSDKIIDPFNGQLDLNARTLRHVSEAFAEDPLRVLRTARFAARYDFKIDPELLVLMIQLVGDDHMLTLTPERVWQEVTKAMGENLPERFFSVLEAIDADLHLFPKVDIAELMYNAGTAALISPSLQAMRFAILTHTLQMEELVKFYTHLKAPTHILRIARKVSDLVAEVNDAHPQHWSAQDVMDLMVSLDAFRRPDDFLDECLPVLSFLDFEEESTLLNQCLHNAMEVNFDCLSDSEKENLQGVEISERLNELRTDRIALRLSIVNKK